VACTAVACVGVFGVNASALLCLMHLMHLMHLMPHTVAAELRLFIVNQPFGDRRRRRRSPPRALWRLKLKSTRSAGIRE